MLWRKVCFLHEMQNLEGDVFRSRQLANLVMTDEDYINNNCCSELIDIVCHILPELMLLVSLLFHSCCATFWLSLSFRSGCSICLFEIALTGSKLPLCKTPVVLQYHVGAASWIHVDEWPDSCGAWADVVCDRDSHLAPLLAR